MNYTTKIDFFEIQSDEIQIDLQSFQFDFKTYDYNPVIFMTFPLIQSWEIKTKFSQNLFFGLLYPQDGEITFNITDIGMSFAFSMERNDAGTIKPFVHFIQITLGESKLESDSKIFSWYMNQVINIGKVLI